MKPVFELPSATVTVKCQSISLKGFLVNILFFCLCGVLLVNCSLNKPYLDKEYFPEGYDVTRVGRVNQIQGLKIRKILLNGNPILNRSIIKFWQQGHFRPLFRLSHPLLEVRPWDLERLEYHLFSYLSVYFVHMEGPVDGSVDLFSHLGCKPLSNLEVQFIMNYGLGKSFIRTPLTLLMITAHELLQRRGATPIQPEVFSSYLREKNGLSPLKSIKEMNLFATQKKVDFDQNHTKQGFLFCRRKKIQS